MPTLDSGALDLRLSDLSTFLAVARVGSIHGAARGLEASPSQVSKSVERLERRLQLVLLTRGHRGVSVSPAGRRAIPRFEAILAELQELHSTQADPRLKVTFVATAFLNSTFVPNITRALPRLRVCSLELPPGVASAYAGERLFDAALTIDTEAWPKSWLRLRIGSLRRALYATPVSAAKLGQTPISPEKLAGIPFITPIYSYHGQVVPGEDRCPLSASQRIIGHQTQTLALALELALQSEHLVFAPEAAARPFVVAGGLVEIPVLGWDVSDTLFLVYDGDRLRAQALREIVAALKETLGELESWAGTNTAR